MKAKAFITILVSKTLNMLVKYRSEEKSFVLIHSKAWILLEKQKEKKCFVLISTQ